jgi:hypothetical protein
LAKPGDPHKEEDAQKNSGKDKHKEKDPSKNARKDRHHY